MPFDGAFGHEQTFRHRRVRMTLGDQSKDFKLSSGKRRAESALGFGAGMKGELLQFDGATLEICRGALKRFLGEFGLRDVLDNRDDADRLAGC